MEQVFGSDMNESVILYIEDVDLNMLPISILDSTPVILYIEDVDLNTGRTTLKRLGAIVILYIEDVDLNVYLLQRFGEQGRSSSTLRMWI